MIKKTVISLLKNAGFVHKRWVKGRILDKEYKVISNTIRSKADKDDAWLFAISRDCNYIFDIGSNIGQAALLMLYHEGIRKIVLVDPNPSALSLAAENIIHNNLSLRAHFVNAFIADSCDQTVDFYTQDTGAAGSKYKGFAKTAAKMNSHYMVNTLTVDYLMDYFQIVPDLVKIDVEGAENDVLGGAAKLAAKGTALFFVEIHSGPELSITKNTQGVLDWCVQNAYTAWYLKDKAPLNIDAITSRGRYHALLVPQGKKFPEVLRPLNEYDNLKM
jgi:FkbM family methyltransferase